MIRYSTAIAVCFAWLISVPAFLVTQETEKPKQDDKIVLPAQDPDTIARRDFMRTKLMYSQNIFEGLTTGDFELIKSGIREVQRVTGGQQWVTIQNEQYKKLTEEFKTTTTRLMEAAESGNIEATALRYYEMSTSCIDCHRHIRKAGYQF